MTVDNLTVLGLLKVLRQVKLDELTVTKINELSGEDLSELVSNLADIQEKLTTIQTTINDCKLEASVFKTGIADAIKNIDSTTTVTEDSSLTDFSSSIENILSNVTSDATATSSQILSGYTAYVKGTKVTGTISQKVAATYTPGTSNQIISAGQYLSGAQTIAGDADLVAANIKTGVDIFGVTGTFTSDATATSSILASGYTAYVNGSKITGALPQLDGGSFGDPGSSSFDNSPIVRSAYNSYVGAFDYPLYGYFPSGEHRVHIPNLLPDNIKAGVKVGGKNGYISGTFTSDANATSSQILSGYTAYVNGSKVSGGVPIRSGSSQALVVATGSGGLYQVFNGGYYPYESHFSNSNTSEVYSPLSSVASALGITANKILSGYTVCGVSGTASAGYGAYNGSMSSTVEFGNSNCTFSFQNGNKSISNTWTSLTTSSYNSRFTYNSKLIGLNVKYAFCTIYSSHGIRRGNGYSSGTTNASYRYLKDITIFATPSPGYYPMHGTTSKFPSDGNATVGLWYDCNLDSTSKGTHKSCNVQFAYTPSDGSIVVDFFHSGANTLAVRTDLEVEFYIIYKR